MATYWSKFTKMDGIAISISCITVLTRDKNPMKATSQIKVTESSKTIFVKIQMELKQEANNGVAKCH